MEEWRNIEKTRGYYAVSSLGRVRNNKSGRILKLYKDSYGYNIVTLGGGYNRIGTVKVTRLVVDAFMNAEGEGRWRHVNGVRNDDRVVNLEEI